MKKLIALAALLPAICFANPIDKLKSRTVSQYEFLKFQLEFLALMLNEKIPYSQLEARSGAIFTHHKIFIETTESNFIFVTSLTGKSKDIKQENCELLREKLSEVSRTLLEGFPAEDPTIFKSKTRLIAEENSNFYTDC